MKPALTLLWPTVAAGIDVAAPEGVNEALVAGVRKVVDHTRVPGFDLHFASTALDHVPLLRRFGDAEAVEWWLHQVQQMVRAVLRDGFGSEPDCDLEIAATALIARDGDRVPAHRHSGHHFTVVYYPHVDASSGDRLNNGALSMIDDRAWRYRWQNRNPAFRDGAAFRIHPRTGLLVAFPGYVLHETDTYRGPGERVSIAACVDVKMEREYR